MALGDCALRDQDFPAAEAAFRRARELAPFDPVPRVRQGDALEHLARFADARDAWTQALALRPRDPESWQRLSRDPFLFLVNLRDPRLKRQTTLRRNDALWDGYVRCERKKEWNLEHEVRCLRGLADGYQRGRDSGQIENDPSLEVLLQICTDQLVEGFALYQRGPQLEAAKLAEAERGALHDYIVAFVAVPIDLRKLPHPAPNVPDRCAPGVPCDSK